MASPAERLRMYRDSAVGGGSVAQRRLSELARGDAARTPGSYLQQHIERRSILADAAGAEAKAPLAKPAPSGDADGRAAVVRSLSKHTERALAAESLNETDTILEPESAPGDEAAAAAAAATVPTTRDWNSPREDDVTEVRRGARGGEGEGEGEGEGMSTAQECEYVANCAPSPGASAAAAAMAPAAAAAAAAAAIAASNEDGDESVLLSTDSLAASVAARGRRRADDGVANSDDGEGDGDLGLLARCADLFRREIATEPDTFQGNSGSWDDRGVVRQLAHALAADGRVDGNTADAPSGTLRTPIVTVSFRANPSHIIGLAPPPHISLRALQL